MVIFHRNENDTVMGKDREGNYHPPKGKPAGEPKEFEQPLNFSEPGAFEKYVDMAEKYTTGDKEDVANVPVRHPNRNSNKHEERISQERNGNSAKQKHDRDIALPVT